MQYSRADIINYVNSFIDAVEKSLVISFRGSLNRLIVGIDIDYDSIEIPHETYSMFPKEFLEELNKNIKSSIFSYVESKLVINNSEIRAVMQFDKESNCLNIKKQNLMTEIMRKISVNMINNALSKEQDENTIAWLINKKQQINYVHKTTNKYDDFMNNCADLIINLSINKLDDLVNQ